MYDVVIHFDSKDPDFGHIVEKHGLKVTYKVRNHVKALLPQIKGKYLIPTELLNTKHTPSLLLEEKSNQYYAQTICAYNGKKLNPKFKRGNSSFFYIFKIAAIVTVSKDKGKQEISIVWVTIEQKRNQVIITEKEPISKEEKEMLKSGIFPKSLENYKEPVLAAMSKLMDHNDYRLQYFART